MGKSYGFVEITGVVAAIDALDIMCKTSGVTLETWERKLGGRLATIIVSGDVASVKEAVEAANTRGIKKPVASGIIASPHPEIRRLAALSASRFRKDKGQGKEPMPDNADEAKQETSVESTKEVREEELQMAEKQHGKQAPRKKQKNSQKRKQPKE